MRSRRMLIKLGGLHLPPLEAGCPDITLLTPEEQDRVWESAKKVHNTLQGLEPGITIDEFREAEGLVAKVPRLGPGETFAGPPELHSATGRKCFARSASLPTPFQLQRARHGRQVA
jgi:hypothetical protein